MTLSSNAHSEPIEGEMMTDIRVENATREYILELTKKKIERLEAELAEAKPDWDIAPEWANWLARDITGKWHWYAAKPVWHDGFWDSSSASEVAWLSASNEPEKRP